MTESQRFDPLIVQFCCNWCSYAGADLAGSSRIQYSPHTRVIRTMCTGMINSSLVVDTLRKGADGVLVCGCHLGDCHYVDGNEKMQRRAGAITMLLEDYSIDPSRFRLEWVSASEATRFAAVVNDFVDHIRRLGPNPLGAEKIPYPRRSSEHPLRKV